MPGTLVIRKPCNFVTDSCFDLAVITSCSAQAHMQEGDKCVYT